MILVLFYIWRCKGPGSLFLWYASYYFGPAFCFSPSWIPLRAHCGRQLQWLMAWWPQHFFVQRPRILGPGGAHHVMLPALIGWPHRHHAVLFHWRYRSFTKALSHHLYKNFSIFNSSFWVTSFLLLFRYHGICHIELHICNVAVTRLSNDSVASAIKHKRPILSSPWVNFPTLFNVLEMHGTVWLEQWQFLLGFCAFHW